ncbi:glycerate kinase [Rhodococcus sp. MSC1_016]|jgi:glycerate kinase|uniref:glycerate kinase n=1 Tax=Rhodococcus sp. MSC1_016 TaxID=2909266 RepID=UPI00202F7B08|nr:glycerate kinase [Rhodococcus sp. MSC1_016]
MLRRQPTVVIAPDSFKGSLTAAEVAAAMTEGVRSALGPDAVIIECPLADGGEGTLDALLANWHAVPRFLGTTDAVGRARTARYGISNDGVVGIIEAAEANGLPQVSDIPLQPMRADSYGVGVIAHTLLDQGVGEIVLCIGGSASTDGGTGFLRALGMRFLDSDGREVEPGGAGLAGIASVDDSQLHPRARHVRWRVATDVDNPLCGSSGAAAVFGPQKGATPQNVIDLDAGLEHLARIIRAETGIDIAQHPGAGAAGGMPACLVPLVGAELTPGARLVTDVVGLRDICAHADVVLTGEGSFDSQSLRGKVVRGVLDVTPPSCPVVVIAGTVQLSAAEIASAGVVSAFSIAKGPSSLTDMVANSAHLVREVSAQIGGLLGAALGARE